MNTEASLQLQDTVQEGLSADGCSCSVRLCGSASEAVHQPPALARRGSVLPASTAWRGVASVWQLAVLRSPLDSSWLQSALPVQSHLPAGEAFGVPQQAEYWPH